MVTFVNINEWQADKTIQLLIGFVKPMLELPITQLSRMAPIWKIKFLCNPAHEISHVFTLFYVMPK
jgi:hypothetical protein